LKGFYSFVEVYLIYWVTAWASGVRFLNRSGRPHDQYVRVAHDVNMQLCSRERHCVQ